MYILLFLSLSLVLVSFVWMVATHRKLRVLGKYQLRVGGEGSITEYGLVMNLPTGDLEMLFTGVKVYGETGYFLNESQEIISSLEFNTRDGQALLQELKLAGAVL